jgi:hypothetical protein
VPLLSHQLLGPHLMLLGPDAATRRAGLPRQNALLREPHGILRTCSCRVCRIMQQFVGARYQQVSRLDKKKNSQVSAPVYLL